MRATTASPPGTVIDNNLTKVEARAFGRELSKGRAKFKNIDEFGIFKLREDVIKTFDGNAKKVAVHDAWAAVVRAAGKMNKDAGLPQARLGGDLDKIMRVEIPRDLRGIAKKMTTDVAKDIQPILDKLSGAASSMRRTIEIFDGRLGNPSQMQRIQIASGVINKSRETLRTVMKGKVSNVQGAVNDLEKIAGKNFNDFKSLADDLGLDLTSDELLTVQTNLRSMKLISDSMEGSSDVIRTGKAELVGSADVTMTKAIENLTPEQAQALVTEFSSRSIGEVGSKTLAESFRDKAGAILAKRERIQKVMDEMPPWVHHTLTLDSALAVQSLGLIQKGKKQGIDLSMVVPRKFREKIEEGVSRPLDLNEVNDLFLDGGLKSGTVDKIRQFLAPQIEKQRRKLDKLIDQGKVENMQDAIDKGFLPDVVNVFETDIRVIADTLARKTVESVNVADHFTTAAKLFGRRIATTAERQAGTVAREGVELIDEAPPGWVQVPDDIKGMEGVFLPADIAQQISRRTDMFTNVESMNSLLKSFDQVQSTIKAQQTVLWPAFHARNALSNQILKVMAGMNPGPKFVKLWLDSFKLRRFSRNPARFDNELKAMKFNNGMNGHQMLDVMRRSRALDGSSMHREFTGLFPTNRSKVKSSVLKTPVQAYRKAAQIGSGTAGFIEDTDKIHMVLWSLDEGLDEISAAERAVSVLFDYGDVTSFEQNVFKRLFPYYCVPTDSSEIMTRDGWKYYDEVSIGDEILTVNPETNESEWQTIDDLAVFDYDDDLLEFESKGLKFTATDDHRWYVRANTFPGGKRGHLYKIKRGHQLNTNDWVVTAGSGITDENDEITGRDAALIGWLVTDGFARYKGNHMEVVYSQSPKKHLDEILDLLGDDAGKQFSHPESGVVSVRATGKLRKRIQMLLPSKAHFPAFVGKLSRANAEIMYAAMMAAEGSMSYNTPCFSQNPGPVLDGFQMLMQMLGKSGNAKRRYDSNCHVIYVKQTNAFGFKDVKHKYVPFSGKIFCPKTQNSTWVMRQDGCVTVTGNTWSRKSIPSSLKSIAMNPGRLSAFTKLLDGVAVDEPIPEDLIPNYVQDQFGVPVRMTDDGDPEFFLLESWIPFFELNKIPLNGVQLFEEAMAMLTPILKIPLEQGINRSFFFKNEITRFEGEKTEWLGFKGKFTKRQRHLLSVIRALNEADNIIRTTPLTAEDSFRRKDAVAEVLRFTTGARLTRVDMERQKSRVKFEKGREQATLQGAFNRAARNGDIANMEAVVQVAREKGIQLKTDQSQIDKVLARAKQIEKGSKKSKAGGLESTIPGLPDIQKRLSQLIKEATK